MCAVHIWLHRVFISSTAQIHYPFTFIPLAKKTYVSDYVLIILFINKNVILGERADLVGSVLILHKNNRIYKNTKIVFLIITATETFKSSNNLHYVNDFDLTAIAHVRADHKVGVKTRADE